ncbi:MAG: hypothetical protein K2W82_10970 [Candidatus Obscuribacterales bacterium]|nr:hypothetical protein [Candidatus Obscuribacterales bacterium]
MERLIPIAGICILVGIAYMMSNNRKAINWRLVLVGISLQFALALLILKVPVTREVFAGIGHGVEKVLDAAVEGATFVFGEELAKGRFIFLVRVGSAIILIAALASLGYYLGIFQRFIRLLARTLVKLMGISGPEAFSSAAAVFVGQVECQVLIKPYMSRLTTSELFCSMAAAMATISGSALVAYTAMGMNPIYLLAASIMSAPAGILIAKIMIPETDKNVLSGNVDFEVPREGVNVFDAIAHGAMEGAKIAANVVVMVFVGVAMVWGINALLAFVLSWFGLSWQIQDIFGVLMTPIALLMGVPPEEAFQVGRLMATEILVNEFVAYGELAQVIAGKGSYAFSPRTQLIATAALCGFANLGSIAINIGGLGAMAPERRGEIARLALRALIAANMGTWMTAAISGLIY